MSRETLAKTLKQLYTEAVEQYAFYANQSRAQEAQAAKTGQTVTFTAGIADDTLRQRAEGEIYAKHEAALQAVQKERAATERELTNAPTTDEANYILAISTRDDLTEAEAKAGLDRYHSHAAQHAIASAAKRSGLNHIFASTDTERYLRDLADVEYEVNRAFSPLAILSASESQQLVTATTLEAAALGRKSDIFAMLTQQ